MQKYIPKTNSYYLEEQILKSSSKFIQEFKKFNNIDIEQIKNIEIIAKKFKERFFEKNMSSNYLKTLQYLSTPFGRAKLIDSRIQKGSNTVSCDEYLSFIILCCDPECNLFKSYIKCDNKMNESQKESYCRKESGLYNKKLIIAEREFYHKFINDLLTDVKLNNSDYIDVLSFGIESFDNITIEEYESILKKAELWRYITNSNSRLSTCTYNLLHQSDLLGLNSAEEKLVFLISAVDPELNLYSIFEEECRVDNIKERALNELGFYNLNIYKLEKLYHQRFLPNKEISPWSK